MVKFWHEQLDLAIIRTKRRIVFMEQHGIGNEAIKEKAILKKQERKKQDRNL